MQLLNLRSSLVGQLSGQQPAHYLADGLVRGLVLEVVPSR